MPQTDRHIWNSYVHKLSVVTRKNHRRNFFAQNFFVGDIAQDIKNIRNGILICHFRFNVSVLRVTLALNSDSV